jgi:pimeloyl-ACP methyl ester carboxylesterase
MPTAPVPVAHHTVDVDGVETFYRDAGPSDSPVVLLPHGYPCSSFQFRHFMAALGDRRRLVAPDLPGFGYSATPDPADLDLAMEAPERVAALIIQNGDIYEDELGPKYDWLRDYWAN